LSKARKAKFKLIDLSYPISHETQVFPTYPKPAIVKWARLDVQGFEAEVIHMATHTATHIDAPLHMLNGGASIDQLPLERFILNALAIDMSFKKPKELITAEDLRKALSKIKFDIGDALLIYTGFEKRAGFPSYLTDHPGLSEDAASQIVDLKFSLVGVDTPNIDHPDSSTFPAHKTLFKNGILVIENLRNLKKLVNKRFKLVALPLNIVGATASPVRAVALIEKKS